MPAAFTHEKIKMVYISGEKTKAGNCWDMAENYFPKKDHRFPLVVSFAALAISFVLVGGSILGILRRRDVPRTGT